MTVNVLHTKAMDVAESAFLQKVKGNLRQARDLFVEAYELERDAAMQLEKDLQAEPTRSVLFRSAASLAMNAGDFHGAEKMVAMGLAGDPPEEIAEEMRSLLLDMYLQKRPQASSYRAEAEAKPIELVGKLGYADATRNRIRLINQTGEKAPYILEVEQDLAEVVRQFWGLQVKVKGTLWAHTHHIRVSDIEAA